MTEHVSNQLWRLIQGNPPTHPLWNWRKQQELDISSLTFRMSAVPLPPYTIGHLDESCLCVAESEPTDRQKIYPFQISALADSLFLPYSGTSCLSWPPAGC